MQLQLWTLVSAPPSAPGVWPLAAPDEDERSGAPVEAAELSSLLLHGLLQREEQPLRLTLSLLPGPLVSSWENRTLEHHMPKQAEVPPADAP